jgi:hypothetical protein
VATSASSRTLSHKERRIGIESGQWRGLQGTAMAAVPTSPSRLSAGRSRLPSGRTNFVADCERL